MKTGPIWSRIAETAACQIRGGWMLIPISSLLTIGILRIGVAVSSFLALALGLVLLGRRYRVTLHRKTDN